MWGMCMSKRPFVSWIVVEIKNKTYPICDLALIGNILKVNGDHELQRLYSVLLQPFIDVYVTTALNLHRLEDRQVNIILKLNLMEDSPIYISVEQREQIPSLTASWHLIQPIGNNITVYENKYML